jgi:LacI family transcriptional regulator
MRKSIANLRIKVLYSGMGESRMRGMNRMRKVILMLDSSRAADRGVIRGILDYSHLRGNWSFYRYSPLFRTPPFSTGQSDSVLDRLKKLDADGIIGYLPAEPNFLQAIISTGFPTVVIPIAEPIKGVVNILQDEAVGAAGAYHFLERGFGHFAYCGACDYWSDVRRDGFVGTVERTGFGVSVFDGTERSTRHLTEQERLGQWLKRLPKPAALMASNDERSAEIVEACHLNGFKIPDQVAILGVDNDEMICQLSSPPLSSIELNSEKVGYEAAEALDCMISRKALSRDAIYFRPAGIVTRQSTDILAIEDAEVARAVRFIRNNARRDIHVSDVLAHSTLSLRALQQRFCKVLGRGINQEIRKTRIRQFADTLLKTNHTVQKIAYDLAFEDINHMSRLFRREMGMTPIEYRERFGPK